MKGGRPLHIGILDIQGSVEEHFCMLEQTAIESEDHITIVPVKKPEHLTMLDGLIIPGGESTVMAKLMKEYELDIAMKKRVAEGMCVYGTCAGAILVSKKIEEEVRFEPLGFIETTVKRNGYGRQRDSFEAQIDFDGEQISAVCIRAPQITEIGENVTVLAKREGDILAARNEHVLVTTFHPELTLDTTVHHYFIEMCMKKNPA